MAVVEKQLDLRVDVFNKTQALSRLLSTRYHQVPNPPKCKYVLRIYPKIIPQKKFSWVLALVPISIFAGVATMLGFFVSFVGMYTVISEEFLLFLSLSVIFAIAWIPLYSYIFKRRKENEIKKIRDSIEYKNYCMALDKEYDELQEKANAEYREKQKEYETEILPKYYEALEKWTLSHNQKIEKAKNDLEAAKAILAKSVE